MARIHALGARSAPTSFYSHLTDAVRNGWAGYWLRRAERETVFVLHSLDDPGCVKTCTDQKSIESYSKSPSSPAASGYNGTINRAT